MKHGIIIYLFTLSLCFGLGIGNTLADQGKGYFVGEIHVKFADDGSYVTLLQELSFIDKNGKKWTASKGLLTDGATIPGIFWLLVGPPLASNHIKAAVLHDQYCEIRTEPFRDVHRMFYEALLASGVEALKAKLMYGAVYLGGPRWDYVTMENARRFFRRIHIIGPDVGPPYMVGVEKPDSSMLKPGTKLHEICSKGFCSEAYLNSYEEQWVKEYIQEKTQPTRYDVTKEDRDKLDKFLKEHKDSTLEEVEEFADKLLPLAL